MSKTKVLFVCVHNSARSQMAEALLKKIGAGRFEAESAGLEPGKLNPLAVAVLAEIGIDISGNRTKSVFNFFRDGALFHYVVTLCDGSERCPVFPGLLGRLHWGFADPSGFEGTWEEKLARARTVREQIREKIEAWVKTV